HTLQPGGKQQNGTIRYKPQMIQANNETLVRVEHKVNLKSGQIQANTNDIQRLTEAFNTKFPGYLE
ncbi:MAG: hypothetical protein OXT68_10855, partial [Chloroflexota bacterium]|nr:hypothetical protein [Chloroflexota bacterium]